MTELQMDSTWTRHIHDTFAGALTRMAVFRFVIQATIGVEILDKMDFPHLCPVRT
jgi:hypothetical protein